MARQARFFAAALRQAITCYVPWLRCSIGVVGSIDVLASVRENSKSASGEQNPETQRHIATFVTNCLLSATLSRVPIVISDTYLEE